jgi:hypothetical protein
MGSLVRASTSVKQLEASCPPHARGPGDLAELGDVAGAEIRREPALGLSAWKIQCVPSAGGGRHHSHQTVEAGRLTMAPSGVEGLLSAG